MENYSLNSWVNLTRFSSFKFSLWTTNSFCFIFLSVRAPFWIFTHAHGMKNMRQTRTHTHKFQAIFSLDDKKHQRQYWQKIKFYCICRKSSAQAYMYIGKIGGVMHTPSAPCTLLPISFWIPLDKSNWKTRDACTQPQPKANSNWHHSWQ